MNLKDYLEWKNITDDEARKALEVTKRRVQQVKNGAPAGRLLAARIVEWSNGAISLEEVLYPENYAA